MIKPNFLKPLTCYFHGDVIYNFIDVKLADKRQVISCYECYKTIEIGKEVYFANLNGVETA